MGGAFSSSNNITEYTKGFHVLNVPPNSPGAQAGLFSYFDFIVAANGIPLDQDDRLFVQILNDNVNKEVKLEVYNSKTESYRETKIIPNKSWGGSGLIGISIRFCSLKTANEHVWHVLDVYDNSPASKAGLESHNDFIVGTPDQIFSDSEDLYNLVSSNLGRTLSLYVYNSRTDQIRLVMITPNEDWGGSGSLGCDVGYGLLHQIPVRRFTDRLVPENTQQTLPQKLTTPQVPRVSSPPILHINPEKNSSSPSLLPTHLQVVPPPQNPPPPQIPQLPPPQTTTPTVPKAQPEGLELNPPQSPTIVELMRQVQELRENQKKLEQQLLNSRQAQLK